jgi:hypothetical protein
MPWGGIVPAAATLGRALRTNGDGCADADQIHLVSWRRLGRAGSSDDKPDQVRRFRAMDRVVRRSAGIGALALTMTLSAGALASAAATGGVTFKNASAHRVDVYTRYGGSSCVSATTAQKLSVDAGQSASVDSGEGKVCYCLYVPERATCPGGWLQVAAGSTRQLQ